MRVKSLQLLFGCYDNNCFAELENNIVIVTNTLFVHFIGNLKFVLSCQMFDGYIICPYTVLQSKRANLFKFGNFFSGSS